MAELIAAIVACIALGGSIVTVWLNLNLKIREIEMKIAEMEHNFSDIKIERKEILEKIDSSNEKIYEYLQKIESKLETKFEMLTVLKTEHDQNKYNCQKNNK